MGNRFLRLALWLTVAVGAAGQDRNPAADPAHALLERAYQALHAKDYEGAIGAFRQAVGVAPNRAEIRKDLAYTLLKVGENEAARDQFAEAMRLDPVDDQAALEYAFLCYETQQPIQARRTFDHLRKSSNAATAATAEQAFENIDRPLREGIARWQPVVKQEPDNFSAHEELARLAEQRDELALAADQYEQAWRLRTDRRDLLVDLARVWKEMDRSEDSMAALVAAWRGGTPRVSEQARELLPAHYPYLSEFERALTLDPTNTALQQDVAYLHREVGQKAPVPRKPATAGPKPASGDSPENLKTRPEDPPETSAKAMGEKSYEKGYLGDALKYFEIAHEDDPGDFDVMLKLGRTYNMLKDDREAIHWFDMARRSPDATTAQEASRAYHNLAPSFERFRTTTWAYPVVSTRWHDMFTYAQSKTEMRLGSLPLRPYVSTRFIGDVRGTVDTGFGAQYLSERSVILAGGLSTATVYGVTGWFEAGEALLYRDNPSQHRRTMPDYRGGVSFAKGVGHLLAKGSHGFFAETADDGIFVSRFADDSLLYSQNRAGITLRSAEGMRGFHAQLLWNVNVTADAKSQYWANYVETGPGIRFRFESLPQSMLFSIDLLRGAYTVNLNNPRRPNYNEVRVGVFYALTR
jgi:Tfp pilus assembly protein PilF